MFKPRHPIQRRTRNSESLGRFKSASIFLDPEAEENKLPDFEAKPRLLSSSKHPLIEIVETPITAFSGKNEQERFVFGNLDKDVTYAEMPLDEEGLETEDIKTMIKSVKKCIARLYTLFDCYSSEKYPANVLKINKDGWMKRIDAAMSDVTECCLEIQFQDNVTTSSVTNCKKLMDEASARYVKFVTDFDIKILGELNINEDNSGVSRSGSVLSNRSDDAEAARKAEIDVNVDYEKISEDAKSLSSEINKFEDWSVVEPHEIEVGMSKIEGWKERAKKLQENLFSMKKAVLKHKLDDEKLRAAECAINYLKSELGNVVEVIEFEDEARCLYSLNKSNSAKVDYPKFTGELEEDFDKFMRVMKKALKSNKIQRSDQVKIIRDNLFGQPKSMISVNLEDVDKAWKILSEIYGGAGRLVKAKKGKLTMMGPMPKPDSMHPRHVRQRVNWLLDLDLNLKELSDLTEKNEDCYCEVFNDSTIKKIKSFFPVGIHTKMSGFQGSAKEKFGQISDHVGKLLKEARGLLADLDGEEVLKYEAYDYDDASASDDDDESTDDDKDDVSGDMRSHAVTDQDLLNLLGVGSFEELDENEKEIYVNTIRDQSSHYAHVTNPSSDVREEPPGDQCDEIHPGQDGHEPSDIW